ncbi:MAG: RIP metalloprotease RseP [Thermoanaerobaculia bacterium]|nr:RIP metalloprotease RseP [Thermoanaerobaculia bacterium]
MQILSNTLAFVFALGVIVFVHEAGHYLVAKAFNIRVLTFSLGFGRRLWGFRRDGTDYRVSLIPLGGYVNFAGQDPAERSDDPTEFLNRPRWQRVLVLLAGPLANVALAIVLVAIVFMTGFAIRDVKELPPVIGLVEEGSAGEAAGLRTGDLVVALDGEPVGHWQDLMFSVITSPEHPIEVTYDRLGGSSGVVTLVPSKLPRDEVGEAGLYPVVVVGEVIPDSAAEAAGVEVEDAILAIDGVTIRDFGHLREQVVERGGEELDFRILRGREEVALAITPRPGPNGAMIGVGQPVKRYGVGEAIVESVRFNADLTMQILFLIDKLFENRISLRASIGGPIEIAAVSGAAARRGFRELLLFMSFISINLFIFNLFPIPILDGGQIAILLVEGTLRRDLSLKLKERITQVGLVMIVMLMAMALYFDLSKNLPSLLQPGREAGSPETQTTE